MEVRGGTKIIKAESTKPLVVAEIGVREGQHALGMLHELNIKKLYLVDHYQRYQETGYQEDAQEKQDNHYKVMFSNMDDYLDRVVFVTRSSELASELFEDEYFDFVYIDACHEYESVKKDIEYWYKKVKPGGYLGGHDYMYGWQGVVKAVDEFALANKLELKKDLDGFDWLIKK